jgi:two-component system, LytTR family, sensor kinase
MQHAPVTTVYIAGGLIGYTSGLAITLTLLALVVRARQLPGDRGSNALLVLCALAWNTGGLVRMVALALSPSADSESPMIAAGIQFTGAAVWPVALLRLWRPFAATRSQQRAARLLFVVAIADAAVIVAALWSEIVAGVSVAAPIVVKELTSFNGCLLAFGAVASLARRPSSRTVWFSLAATLMGVATTTAGIFLVNSFNLPGDVEAVIMAISEQSTLIILLGTFFLFAEFRFADLFIRQSLRIATIATMGMALVILWRTDVFSRYAFMAAKPDGMRLFVLVLETSLLLGAFVLLDRNLDRFVDRWIIGVPDYSSVLQRLRHDLNDLHSENELLESATAVVRNVLRIENVSWISTDRLATGWRSADVLDGDVALLTSKESDAYGKGPSDAALLVPVRTGDTVEVALAVSPAGQRGGLLSHEVDYLRSVATACGMRLDALRRERDRLERHRRDSLLQQQVAEAELRALRAQINPHFLFNALNTVADLIVINPAAAEAVTLRLAQVFRHVLTVSGRSMVSLAEEVDFIRAYVAIEEARFSGRLHVSIDMHPGLARHPIPSLLLQPVVENALKHGLAPKLGPGHLSVSVQPQDDRVCVQVVDDGVGVSEPNGRESTGIGLANIAKRLAVAYDGQASLHVAPRREGGTCVTICVPRSRGPAGAL